MALVIAILYTVLTHLSPMDVVPALAPFRIMIWVMAAGVVSTLTNSPYFGYILRAPQPYLVVCFIGMTAVTRILRGWFGGAHLALMDILPSVMPFFLIAFNVYRLSQIRWLIASLAAASLYMLIPGIYAYWTIDPTLLHPLLFQQRVLQPDGTYEVFSRLRYYGILNDPNDYAQFLLVVAGLLLVFWKKGSLVRNMVVLFTEVMILYGVFLTHSRGAVLAIAVMAGFILKDRYGAGSAVLSTTLLVTLLLAMGFTGGREISMESGEGRTDAWSEGMGMFKSSPLWGVGYGSFLEYHNKTAHNSFLLCLSEMGLIGCFFWVGIIVVSVLQLKRLAWRAGTGPDAEEVQRYARILRYPLYSFLTTSWFLSRTYSPTLFSLLALVMALGTVQRVGQSVPEPTLQSLQEGKSLITNWASVTVMCEFASIALIYITLRLRSFV